MSTVVCGSSSLPIYALSCSCSRRRRYLFRSDLFKKHTARKLSLDFFLLVSVAAAPSLNFTCSVLYMNFLPPTSSRFCTFYLRGFKNESFDSVSTCLIANKYISSLCNMNCLLSLLSIPDVIFYTFFKIHRQFMSSSSCLKLAPPFKTDCTPLVH